jgi:outer membrane autotransporter protein
LESLSKVSGEKVFWRARTLAGTLSLAGLLACGEAVALDITSKVVIDNPAVLAGEDLFMDGGTLLFNVSPTLDNDLAFIGGKTSTVAAAAGQIVVFGPGAFTFVDIGAGATAIFGSATDTGRIVIDTDDALSDATGRVIVAGGTLAGGSALNLLLATAASTTVRAGATLDIADELIYVHNLKGSGRVTTEAGGELALLVDDNSSTEFSGVISGAGAVSAMNMGFANGTVILSGNNTYTGGTYICSCTTLQLGNGGTSGSIRGDVLNEGTLAFNRSDIYVFSGEITDGGWGGNVVQMGTGTTVLTANNTYTGTTTVAAGKLVVNGSIAGSDTTVLKGATLGGTGILGNTTIERGGTHAPGNSIGTQTVSGNYVLGAGAVLEIEVNAAGQSDKLVVTGTVDLTGSVLHVIGAPGSYDPNGIFLFINNGAVTGNFARVTTNFAFLAPIVSIGGPDVGLTLERNSVPFASLAQTRNQASTAAALDRSGDGALYRAVVSQTAEGAPVAFDALSGEVHATLGGLLIQDSSFVRDALTARLAQAFHAGNGAGAALSAAGPMTIADARDTGRMSLGAGDGESPRRASARPSGVQFWSQGFGSWGDFGSDGNAAGLERTLGGFVSGMDAVLGGSWRVGLATGYAQSNASVDDRLSSADVESTHLAAYAGGPVGALALRGGAAWTWHDIDTTRLIAFPGFLERANARYDGDTGQVFGEAALPFAAWRGALEPFAGLAYVHAGTDRFTETGSVGALRSGGIDEDVTFSTLGFRAATTVQAGGIEIAPRLSLAWRHAFGASAPGLALSFVTTGTAFGINGVPIAEDSALIEAGLDFVLGPDARLGVSYNGQIASDVDDHGISGSLFWQF